MKRQLLILSLLGLFSNHIAYAVNTETKEDTPSNWTGTVQFGYSGTGGNTEDNNVTGKFNLAYQKDKWMNALTLTGLFSNNQEKTTAEKYTGNLEFNYNFKKRVFSFLHHNTTYDLFNAYDLTMTTSAGYGLRLIDASKVTLDVQAGPGYRDARISGTKKHDSEITGYTAATLNWIISKTANLSETVNADTGEKNTATKSVTALSTDIIGNLGMQTSFTITHNSTLPKDSKKTKKTDYQTDVTLLFSF